MRFLGQINDLAHYAMLTQITKDKFLSGNDSGKTSPFGVSRESERRSLCNSIAMVTPRLLNIPRSPE
jgi:hypothetical protein